MKVYLSISWGAFQRAHHIFIQNCVEAKLLEPQHWNFAWINGRLCALRQNQSGFLNMNTLGTIKVLLVPVAFESRVEGVWKKGVCGPRDDEPIMGRESARSSHKRCLVHTCGYGSTMRREKHNVHSDQVIHVFWGLSYSSFYSFKFHRFQYSGIWLSQMWWYLDICRL